MKSWNYFSIFVSSAFSVVSQADPRKASLPNFSEVVVWKCYTPVVGIHLHLLPIYMEWCARHCAKCWGYNSRHLSYGVYNQWNYKQIWNKCSQVLPDCQKDILSVLWTEYPTSQFISDTGFIPLKLLSCQIPVTNGVPRLPTLLSDLENSGVSVTPPHPRYANSLEWFIEFRKILYICLFIMKDTTQK